MRRIKARHNDKDQVICIAAEGKHRLYYQPFGEMSRFWLFDTKKRSVSVQTFFKRNGRKAKGEEYTMTLGELYRKGNSRNIKINQILERIPGEINYVVQEVMAS